MNRLYPIFLKVEGLPCLVVGGGRVATRKVGGLVECGARVRVVAPEASDEIARLATSGGVEWSRKAFEREDLSDARVVIVATNDPEVNSAVRREARARGVLCNVVDEPDLCDFYMPAIVRRGDLKIAVSTNGRSPELAKAIRALLERRFGEEFGRAVDEAGRLRDTVHAQVPDDPRRRMVLLKGLVHANELVEALDREDRGKVEEIIQLWKSFSSD
ncbi:bifunctional precorrin-2 dehydrogenase/sirohydrochlorin ferrochelatase [Candidatus Sumerlaeota bacterium]|nr:bifunctional precorrin-2 dehydrogenase/sirohydrochlorin ferrochelatase [Candidatus Sumerlaeota bacterium]